MLDLEELSKILHITTENWRMNKDDDYFTFQFIAGILDMVEFKDHKGMLSDEGRNILLFKNLNKAVKDGNETVEQKREICKATLYIFTGYTLCVLYIGFLQTKNVSNEEMWSKVPTDMIETMEEVKEKIVPKLTIYKGLLDHLLKDLAEEYAKIFNCEKKCMFMKELFSNPVLTLGDGAEELTKIKQSAMEMKA
tara:strand:- start:423 stop:1004 length:582 start_codon:yes stop_codon:yes gene_type:complete